MGGHIAVVKQAWNLSSFKVYLSDNFSFVAMKF